MARISNGFVGSFATTEELTAKFPPNEYAGCSANIGLVAPIAKTISNGISWAVISWSGAPVSGADILSDTMPESPGTWPALTIYYISDAAAGVDVGTQVVWIPTEHVTLPATKGWRFAFYPSATVV